MIASQGNPFWTYSLALYGRPGVDAACLALQDRLDLDVNMLLFCCWAGSRGRALEGREVGALAAAVRALRDGVIRPLRQARRALKIQAADLGPAAQDLRRTVKADELAAEAIQQNLMHSALQIADGPPSATAGAANLRAYLRVAQATPAGSDWDALAGLLAVAFPELSEVEARALLGQ
jgi:uncharacterized protein (TIGR02444 family)